MKCKLSIILLFVCSFSFVSKVNAGVCDGYEVNGDNSTCNSMSISISLPSYLNNTYGSYFLRPGYVATTYSSNAMSFCLDPGLPRPTQALTYIRELDNSDISKGVGSVDYYDDGIYRMYQLFYNDLVDLSNSGDLNDSTVNTLRSYFQNAVRVWTYKNEFDYLSPENAKYEIDAPHFQTCANYIDSNVEVGTPQSISDCFGSSDIKSKIQRYYDANEDDYIWKNPLSIITDSKIVTNVDGSKYYRYEFNISFNNGSYQFFDGNYSKGISYQDIQLEQAKFYLNDLTVNGESCSAGICYNYSGGGDVTSGTERQFIVELTETQYEEFASKSDDGSVNVTMHYGYQHPLNIENLFTARYDLYNTYQRMLVIQNYIHYDTISIGKEPESTKCEHNSSGYINSLGNKVSNLRQFMASCGCSSVDKTLIADGDLTYYNQHCSNNIIDESYSGSIGDCTTMEDASPDNVLDESDSDTNYDSYSLGYQKITQINNYCKEICNENININNLKGRYTTKAGMYFEFNKYPNLIANKKCTVTIDYVSWKSDYKTNLEMLVEKYNEWKKADTLNNSLQISRYKNCDHDRKKTHSYNATTYTGVKIVNDTSLEETEYSINLANYERTSCGSSIDWQVEIKKKEFQNQVSKANAIKSLQTDLEVCNKRLFDTTNENFYDFSQQLNYYYYQTYADGYKVVKNNERASLGGINDSSFKTSQTISGTSNEEKSGSYVTYSTLTEDGIDNESIYTYNADIVRNVTYNVDYERPMVNKYSEIFTGKINSTYIVGKSISLGYGYDTDASAIAKSDNNTYYSFSKLGASDKKIFNKFKTGNEIKRYCTYEITNEIIEGCEDGSCDSKLDIVFRIVDPNNLDPNSRLGTSDGFKNWDNIKGKTVLSTIQSDDTYNPDNLEYSFTLDSATIKKIREYNSNCDARGDCDPITYSSTDKAYSELSCNEDGNECTSEFITELAKRSGQFGSNIATNTDGRDNWKYLIYDSSTNKWSIEEKKAGKVSSSMFSSLIAQYKGLGVDVTP